MKIKLYIFGILITAGTILMGQEIMPGDDAIQEIKNTLEVFQKGYTERDTSKAAEWCDDLFYDNVEIIGTWSIHPNTSEWFKGKDRAVKVFQSDWIGWGDLVTNIEEANIGLDGDLAWVSFEANVTRSPENSRGRTADESAGNMLKYFSELSEQEDKPNGLKLMEAAYYANLVLYQYEQGEEFIWPIRISGVLQRKDGVWKFRQMHFSHPNRGFPNVRN